MFIFDGQNWPTKVEEIGGWLEPKFEGAEDSLDDYLGGVLKLLDLRKSFVTGSAMSASLFTVERRVCDEEFAGTLGLYPPVYIVPDTDKNKGMFTDIITHLKKFRLPGGALVKITKGGEESNSILTISARGKASRKLHLRKAKPVKRAATAEASLGQTDVNNHTLSLEVRSREVEEKKTKKSTTSLPITLMFSDSSREATMCVEAHTVPGADIDIAVDAATEKEFDEIASGHYKVFRDRWPDAELERMDKPGGTHQWTIVSRNPADLMTFREVQIYRGDLRGICSHHLPQVRCAYTQSPLTAASAAIDRIDLDATSLQGVESVTTTQVATETKITAAPERSPGRIIMTAATMFTALSESKSYPNVYYFSSLKKPPQDILIKNRHRGFDTWMLPKRIREGLGAYEAAQIRSCYGISPFESNLETIQLLMGGQ